MLFNVIGQRLVIRERLIIIVYFGICFELFMEDVIGRRLKLVTMLVSGVLLFVLVAIIHA